MTRPKKIILFVALALIVIFYALANNLRESDQPIISRQPINPNSRYEIPISDSPMDFTTALTSDVNEWPIYRNEQFGFSLKYPPGWGVTNEKFGEDVWFIGFRFSPHDFFFGVSISRDPLEDKIELEKGKDFLRLEEGPKADGVKITKIVHSLDEYYQENTISYVFVHRDYSFALRINSEFFRLILPTLRFF